MILTMDCSATGNIDLNVPACIMMAHANRRERIRQKLWSEEFWRQLLPNTESANANDGIVAAIVE